MRQFEPYLSVVVATRNDDHGGDPLKRLQAFVNCFDEQCRRTGLDAELIVVEWNPPADRPHVGTLLRLPHSPFCQYRFIEVPPALHQMLRYSDVLPLFQMIAKNVGIRRARGRFVLATNIDIIFSTELIDYLATRRLEAGRLYRVDRHDIRPDVPLEPPLEAQMAYCQSHQLRVHTRWGSYPVDAVGRQARVANDIVDGRTVRLGRGWHILEGDDGGPRYRWGSDVVELFVDTEAPVLAGRPVLDIEIESNPYDPLAWVDLIALDGERWLVQQRVAGQGRLVVPLDAIGSGHQRTIRLRVIDSHPDSRLSLPAFERRDALHYRVVSARLRLSTSADWDRHEYPKTAWTNKYQDQDDGVRLTLTPIGLEVMTLPSTRPDWMIEYGPMRAPSTALYRFNLSCTVTTGDLSFGVSSGDGSGLMPATVTREGDVERRYEIAVDLRDGQPFWIAAFNQRRDHDAVSRFVIHRLDGSADVRQMGLGSRVAGPRLPVRRGWRWWAGRVAHGVSRALSAALGHRLRYHLVRGTPEFRAVEQARRASDEQLRALAPLRYLGEFETFLRDRRPDNLHVNACGDFQLLSREHWDQLCAYPEFETFSMNIDGLFSYIADAAGIREEVLPMPIYHLEHEVGSGWSPEGEAVLRRRIAERGITWVDASTVYIWAAYMRWLGRPMIFNGPDWGMAAARLPERGSSHAGGSLPDHVRNRR